MKAWKKGALIGLIIGIIIAILLFIMYSNCNAKVRPGSLSGLDCLIYVLPAFFILAFFYEIVHKITGNWLHPGNNLEMVVGLIIHIITTTLIFVIIGALIGWIYGKRKSKKQQPIQTK